MFTDSQILSLHRQSKRKVPVSDNVSSGLQGMHIRVPATKPFSAYLRQQPGIAVGVQTPRREGRPRPNTYMGFTLIYQRQRKVLHLDQRVDGPPRYFIQRLAPPIFPWERLPEAILGTFSSTLDLDILSQWARIHLNGPIQAYALGCYKTGFTTQTRAPPHTNVAATNLVLPDTPEGEAVDATLAKLASRGRLVSHPLPVLVGTRTLKILVVTKLQVNEDFTHKVKHRMVVHGSEPHNGTDPKSWIDGANTAFIVPFNVQTLAAHILARDIVAGTLRDYKSFFLYIPKAINEVPHNAVWWRGKFMYCLDHLFGHSTTPFSADVHARVIQFACQAAMNAVSTESHDIVRIVDDSLVLHPGADIANMERVNDAFVTTVAKVNQPLQHDKDRIGCVEVMFNGLLWHLLRKELGYPRSKMAKLLFILGRALGMSTAQIIGAVPRVERDAIQSIGQHLSRESRWLSRKEAESLTSKLVFSISAMPHMAGRIPPIRASWIQLVGDHTKVRFSTEARTCLRHFFDLFSPLETVWFPLRNLFKRPHAFTIRTDASGKHGFGGFGPRLWFATALPAAWNLHLKTFPKGLSIALLELGALLLILYYDPGYWKGQVILWETDSATSVGALSKGSSPSAPMNRLLWAVQRRCTRLSCIVHAKHLPRESNRLADALSNLKVDEFLAGSPTHQRQHRFKPQQHALNRLGKAIYGPASDRAGVVASA